MSDTFFDASLLVASELVDLASGQPGGSRLLVRDLPGVRDLTLDAIAEAALSLANTTVLIGILGHDFSLPVVDTGSGFVVPFLVQEPPPAIERPGCGSRGFNSRLRDFLPSTSASGHGLVLLTFDADPLETQESTMDSSAPTKAIRPGQLARRALLSAAPQGVVLKLVAESLASCVTEPVSAGDLVEALRASKNLSNLKDEEVGEQLHQVPWVLRDPSISDIPTSSGIEGRVHRAAAYRHDVLEALNDPASAFDDHIRDKFQAGVASIICAARIGSELDWSQFTYDELRGASGGRDKPTAPRFAAPERLSGINSAPRKTGLLADGVTSVVVSAASAIPATLEVPLSSALHGGFAVVGRVRQFVDSTARFVPLGRATDSTSRGTDPFEWVTIPLPRGLQLEDGGWLFIELQITTATRTVRRPAARMSIALCVGETGAVSFEQALNVDVERGAFIVDGVARVGALDASGRLMYQQDHELETDDDRVLVDVPGAPDLPALHELLADSVEVPSVTSPEHFAISQWALGGRAISADEWPSETASLSPGGDLRVTLPMFPPAEIPVAHPSGVDLQRLERSIVEQPTSLQFVLDEGVGRPRRGEPQLPVSQLELEEFFGARTALFSRLGSLGLPVIAVSLDELPEVHRYLNAYEVLLNSAARSGEGMSPGLDQLLWIDSVQVDATETLVAPTNPLTLMYLVHFQTSAREWLTKVPTGNLDPLDLELFSPQWLVPFGALFQQKVRASAASFPWRSYLPLERFSQRGRRPSTSGYIADRVAALLSIYPLLASPSRKMHIGFVNPGQGSHIVEALRKVLVARSPEETPQFELVVIADSEVERHGSALDEFMAVDADEPEFAKHRELDDLLREKVRYRRESLDSFSRSEVSFAHLIVFEGGLADVNVEALSAEPARMPSSIHAGGLATSLVEQTVERGGAFSTQAMVGVAGHEKTRLSSLADKINRLMSVRGIGLATGTDSQLPVIGQLTSVPDAMHNWAFDKAVWVVHVDDGVGLDAFQLRLGVRFQIIDYASFESMSEPEVSALTATSRIDAYTRRLSGALAGHATVVDLESAALTFLDMLNQLSGAWALELVRYGDDQLRDRLATVIAAAWECADASRLWLPISLEDVIRSTGRTGRSTAGGLHYSGYGEASDDLLILELDLGNPFHPILRGNVCEVKFRSGGGTDVLGAARQVLGARELLSAAFGDGAQPGRLLRGRALARLISSQIQRLKSYGSEVGARLLSQSQLAEALGSIGEGRYELLLQPVLSDGRRLIGDVVTLEPSRHGSPLITVVATPSGSVRHVRLGASTMNAVLAGEAAWEPIPLNVEVADFSTIIVGEVVEGGSLRAGAANGRTGGEGVGSGMDVPTDRYSASAADAPPVPADLPASDLVVQPSVDRGYISTLSDLISLPSALLGDMANRLDDVLARQGIQASLVDAADTECGPNTIRFRLRLVAGQRIAALERARRDIARELGVDERLRVWQSGPDVFLGIPRKNRAHIRFPDVLPALRSRERERGDLPIILGVSDSGTVAIEDLTTFPHLLVAGGTGSGKSVFLTALMGSIAQMPAEWVEIVAVDVKGLDFAGLSDLPHFHGRGTVEDAASAIALLRSLAHEEIPRRREILRAAGARNPKELYRAMTESSFRQIVVVVDEYAQLTVNDASNELEGLIQQFAQFARAFGIHLVIATQRPDRTVITGTIKANLPVRASLRLPTLTDSQVILDQGGAEDLFGQGDLLFLKEGEPLRLQVPDTTPQDVMGSAVS